MMIANRILLVLLVLLVWADTSQVIYLAKRMGHCRNRHRILLRSRHYFCAAVAIASKALVPMLLVVLVADYCGWPAIWAVNGVLVAALLFRARTIEGNQEVIDKLRAQSLYERTNGNDDCDSIARS